MAINPVAVQTKSVDLGSAVSGNLVLTSAPTLGNFVAVAVDTYFNATVTTSITDSNGNAYTPTPGSPTTTPAGQRDDGKAWVFYLKNAPANASATLVITNSAAVNTTAFAAEFVGVDKTAPFQNESGHSDATSQTNINDPSLTPPENGCLLFGSCVAGTVITSSDSPWTGVDVVRSGNYAQYFVQGAAASLAMAFTQTPAGWWTSRVASFKAAAVDNTIRSINQPADDESGWLSETTKIEEWWGSGILDRGWFDHDFISNVSGSPQAITGVKYTNPQTFGAAKLSFRLTGAKYTNSQTFGAATIGRGAVNVGGVKYTNPNTFGAATIGRGAVGIGGVRFNNTSTFGSASVSASARILAVKFNNPNTFGTALVKATYGITGAKFTNVQSFKVAVVSASYSIGGVKFINSQTFGVATVGRGAVNIQAHLFTNAQTFATAVVASLLQRIDGVKFNNNQAFFASTVFDSTSGSGSVVPNDWLRYKRRR